jgi:hypothetical protein
MTQFTQKRDTGLREKIKECLVVNISHWLNFGVDNLDYGTRENLRKPGKSTHYSVLEKPALITSYHEIPFSDFSIMPKFFHN